MLNKIKQRVINEANYIINAKATIRQTSKYFNVSKSTVHDDVHKRLYLIDYNLYDKVSKILSYNFNVKHFRGGMATKLKYIKE